MRTLTVLDCTGVGPGGISRVLTEIVRNWPAGQQLAIVSAPRGVHLNLMEVSPEAPLEDG